MERCNHHELLAEVSEEVAKHSKCIICAVKERAEEKAKEIYGEGFNVIRYRYDIHKQELQTLLCASSIEQIPPKYIHFMSQLVNRKPDESILRALPTGIAGNWSSLMLVIPGVYTRGNIAPDTPLTDPDDVPPASGWTHYPVPKEQSEDDPPEQKRTRLHTEQDDD